MPTYAACVCARGSSSPALEGKTTSRQKEREYVWFYADIGSSHPFPYFFLHFLIYSSRPSF